MQYVTFVTPGPLSPGCGVELGCPAWRWPESVLSAQSAAAPAPEQQTDCYIYTTSTYSYNSLLKCKMLEFMGRNTEIDEEFWWSNKARLGLRVRYLLLLQAALPQEFVSRWGEDLLDAAAALQLGLLVALRLRNRLLRLRQRRDMKKVYVTSLQRFSSSVHKVEFVTVTASDVTFSFPTKATWTSSQEDFGAGSAWDSKTQLTQIQTGCVLRPQTHQTFIFNL